jgi:transposase InsO family protein
VACDFFVSVSATFPGIYVFVAMEIGSRRILLINVTDHPTAEWTIQQFREFLAYHHPYRFVIHDRDSIFSTAVDQALKDCGVRALKTPVRTPTANAFCERVIGTIGSVANSRTTTRGSMSGPNPTQRRQRGCE